MSRVLDLTRQSAAGLRLLVALTVLLGLVYPAVLLGVGQLVPGRANGSLITLDGRTTGSSLIGQQFGTDDDPASQLPWFQPRPSAAGTGYDPQSSGASNLGPNNADLVKTIEDRRAAVASREGVEPSAVPADAVTASGSGLDPDISPAYAQLQVARVARERGLPVAQVEQLVEQNTHGRDLGFIGEPSVDVVTLNADLARLGSPQG
ncbi:K+-transporting ATPase ATPase C chain [Quadrisphaera granulorum]|uniref:Potassium-transporting ATPase KdpC subunit n=1 Tax=Quadrisphaera granulorum TaxID=317664 RepID=A0A316A2F5_9ACTN|nr:potassium-transporting ATPase subunit KdpC [Quadrisphaera granulorum]PWJ51773.1 K+-transporting ATPase ATPase C chain [Quadrisphaera granulorum]SZE97720.1 K+-transporting ATPase ATPase C chain [Quadrisphaera granulorum]